MKHTPVQWLEIVLIWDPISEEEFEHNMNCWKQAKEMEKEQAIELIKQTAMFMAASNLDEDIANMSYEDVYKTYYEEPSNDMCKCKVPQSQIKVSENGTYAYCTKCIRTLNTNEK